MTLDPLTTRGPLTLEPPPPLASPASPFQTPPHAAAMAATPAETRTTPLTGQDPPAWRGATPEQLIVLRRMAVQRDRLVAARSARAAQRTLRRLQARAFVSPDAPLLERVATFARLHPLATAAATGLAWVFGPRRLLQIASTLLPVFIKLRG